MRPPDRGVQHPMLGVRVASQRRQQAFPDARRTPAHEPLIHRIPRAVLGGQQAPLRAAPAHPLHRLDEVAAGVLVLSNVGVRLLAQELPHLAPLFVAQSYVGHAPSLQEPAQMSTEPSCSATSQCTVTIASGSSGPAASAASIMRARRSAGWPSPT